MAIRFYGICPRRKIPQKFLLKFLEPRLQYKNYEKDLVVIQILLREHTVENQTYI